MVRGSPVGWTGERLAPAIGNCRSSPVSDRPLQRRRVDALAYFDRPGTSDTPAEAINGRLEHLRGSVLDLRNLTYYIARSLAETGGFRPHPRPLMR